MLEESAVKVCVRVRPLIEREETAAESAEPVKLYWKTDKKTIHQVDDGNLTKNFSFDRVFRAEETTLQLYQELAKPLVVSTVEGYNGTIFAYGQTSSGKTFTMMGSSLTPGVIPLAMEDVFHTIKTCPKKEFLLRVSYLEIYNETVTDLLCDSWKRKPLEIREGNNKNVYVADLTEELVTSPEQALAWIRKGEKNRHYGKTKMNQRSSRSHTIFRMILENRDRGDSASGENPDSAIIVSHLNLVDLAGAERASQTGAEGTRFKEGCNINRSLFTLGQVIKKLSDETQKGFTNYRDSKLTRILQNSLGGNAKTVIICTITPVTLEETLSTLQFASAAKNMKNDPHVTEVSDDGALLRRYRNEIVDLKRRLHEVSSVTQTTATEKETLSQILQEKDQLQREQEDRIKNLTKLLVTSSNFVTIKKMPKRRVTWGGKLPSPAFHHAGESDLSFAEPFFKKRKADMSVLTEQNEDGDEFDSTFDMEMNQSNLTVRGFAESEFLSPNQLNKLSEKVSCLELQLENETQQKQEAMEEVETFQRRVAELEKQLEGKSLMPADAQLEKETQQNQEDMEEVETFEMKVAELEKQLEKSQMPADAQEQMKKGFEETIQLCETLVSEKEMVATERDYLKQELNILMEQTENLKKEKAALLQEMEEKKEMDEFNSLEEESKREYEKELLNDISSLKKAMEVSGRKSQELEANLVAMSEELKKKGDWAEELQRSSDVDLVQQVKQLRRSLDDAEGLSRDTKKEWAHLRSENISLKERAVTLTAGYERMEAQVNGLRHQLETEKLSFKKMQVDLQRELQGAFEENTKLTTLLDGKVPKNLIDSIELEKTVAVLKKELDKSHEDERTLQAKIEDLSALQDLPDKVNSLMKQVCDLTEELCAVQKERDMLVSAKACSEEEAHQFRELAQSSQEQLVKLQDDLSKAELRENDLTQQCTDITEQLETLRKDLARSSVENSQLLTTVEESSLRLKENEQHRASIEDQLCGMQQVMKELEEKLAESESSKEKYDNLSQEHQDQIRQLSEEVIQVQAELKRQQHLNSEQQSCAQQDDQHQLQIQELRAALEAMTEERSQLNSDLQQNMEMAAETQGLLHSIQEELRQQRQVNSDLESQSLQKESLLEQQMRQLSDALESGEAERERLLFEKTDSPQNHAELEKLLSAVTSLTGERDQLQEILEGIREERNQLKRDLEDNVEMQHLNSAHQPHREHQESDLRLQIQLEAVKELEERLEAVKEERSQLKTDLQDNVEMMIENQEELREAQEKIKSLQGKIQQLQTQNADVETRLNNINAPENTSCLGELQNQIRQLNEELKSVRDERERLLSEKTDSSLNHAEELEKLLSTVTSLTEERNQLQEILEGVREERNQLKRDLEDKVEMLQQLGEELETMTQERCQLKGDLQENLEMAAETQGLLHSIQEELRQQRQVNSDLESQSLQKESLLEQQAKQLNEELESVRERLLSEKTDSSQNHAEELEKLLSTVTSLTGERDQLQEILKGIREERNQLKRDLEDNVEMMIENQEELRVALEKIHHQEENMKPMETANLEELQSQLKEELESVRAERERLLSEKTDSSQNHAELEKLLSTVTSLTGERDQLQEILEGIREERNQLKRDLEDNVEMSIKVQEELKQQQHLNSEQQTEREHQEAQLQQQLQQLGEELETMTQERCQLKGDLQENLEMAAETQGLLHSIQEELRQQRQVNSDLESQSLQKESLLEQQAKQLNEELESVRERFLSEKTDSSQNHAEELEKLLSTVTSLTGERDQLQEILEGIREERNQLKRDLEDKVEMMQQLEEEGIHMRDERAQIQRDLQENMEMMKQLEEECKGFKEGQFHFKVEADTSHKMLSDANATISILTEQIYNLEQSTSCCSTRAGEGLRSRLEASMQKLQVSLVRLQLVIDGASKPGHGPLVGVTQVEEVMIQKLLPLLPKPTKKIYSNINRSTVQITNGVWDTKVLLKLCAKDYKTHVEALVQNDLAVFEERRMQDLLLCRAQAPSHSVKVVENDLLGVWDERLSELLDRREDYLQKMNSVLKKLEESLATHPAAVSEELRVRERSNEALNALCMVHSPDSAAVENFLERELARRSALAQANTLALQGLRDERCGLLKELGVVRAQADSQLKEERSKTSTLLQILERAPVKTEADLLRDNQQLALQRQQLDGEIKEMQMRVEQLEEDQIKAADNVSNNKQATQLLQTELQDACAQVKDREGSIQILKEKLRETEVLAKRRASPSALELEELKAKLLKMELEMTASSSKHQEELLRMTTVLNHKEDALRTLKETLRRSQQEGEQSFNEGQDLHARLITARGRMVQSNILLEKNKLEEELKRLQSKISELESLVSTQQGEITKWKARAIKLKENKRDVVDKPLSPCTPTKHRLPMNSEQFLNSPKRFLNSPKRLIDSPKKFLDSPKSKFFDVRPGSESMSINCPKQFFDNSNLGTIQDASASVDKKDEWWPLSPKQSDVCKQQ
ncbi:centromere-associated protein E isoform X5 [Salmo trutta]|uniref:centromere-associated protein E isoform X5 n=1 Tax=Salmo trutta TaxID=8032 RepID=UPI001131A91A|nr:centromere-associated protein E-like isoform X5 [Salmo trutta]